MKKILFMSMCLVFIFSSSLLLSQNDIKINTYGYVKLDAIYETGASSHGNFAIWAKNPGENSGLFYLTARQTRLGFNIGGIKFGDFKATAKIEMDFYGSGAENKPMNYMRHAYLKITNGKLTLIAGQYWDIICPLNASTINYPVLWGAGNMGYRRPQLSLRYDLKSGKNIYSLQAGVFRTIAADYNRDGIEDGIAGGFPTLQGRCSAKINLGGKKFVQLGVSGHFGKSKGAIDYNSTSLNFDFILALSPKLKLVAEYFNGKNLGTYLGGIVQSIDSKGEIRAKGIFANLQSSLNKKTSVSLGFGIDNPIVNTTGARAKNTTFFGNIVTKLHKALKVGFEISWWSTDFLYQDTQKTLRFQNSWTLSF
jgi:hypothetical protein